MKKGKGCVPGLKVQGIAAGIGIGAGLESNWRYMQQHY